MTSNSLTVLRQESPTLYQMRENPARYPRLRTFVREEAVKRLGGVVYKAMMYQEGKVDDFNRVSFISEALYDEMMKDCEIGYRNLCFEEMDHIISEEVVANEMYFGITVKNILNILKKYATGKARLMQNEIEMAKQANPAKTEPSPVDIMISAYAAQLTRK